MSSRSDSEDGLSDEEIDVENVDEESRTDEGILYTDVTGRNAEAQPKTGNAQKIQRIRLQQNAEKITSFSKNKLPTKLKNAKLEENWSKVIKDTGRIGSERDLDIDVEAFVNHVPVLEDVDQAVSLSCPFCSVLYEDVTRHIKDCHDSGEEHNFGTLLPYFMGTLPWR